MIERKTLFIISNESLLYPEENSMSLYNIVTLLFKAKPPPLDKLLDAVSVRIQYLSCDIKCTHHFLLHYHFHNGFLSSVLSALEKGKKLHRARSGLYG